MKAIILAGGTGTRLWPLSRKRDPKQVQPVIGGDSLLQATYRRIRKGFAAKDVYVATAESQANVVRTQLPSLPKKNLIAEPCRRETAAAIGYALAKIAAKEPHATFVTVNSDAYVRDEREYHRILRGAARAVAAKPDHAVLVGVRPSYPETGYGYIKMGHKAGTGGVYAVDRFVEKPDAATARRYVADGRYLWNPTLIVGRVDRFLGRYDRFLPAHASIFRRMVGASNAAARRLFAQLRPISIDYGILEKDDKLLVIPADFGWADVGNWRTVRDIVGAGGSAVRGLHVGVDSNNNLIYAPKGKLIATAGLKDTVIVDAGDALLVCPADRSQDVKRIVASLENDRALRKYA